MKRQIAVLLIASCVLSLAACGDARSDDVVATPAKEEAVTKEDELVTQEFDFYSDDEHLILYNYPETYELDGKSYALQEGDVDYETLGTRDTISCAVDMNVEELTDVPDTYTFEGKSGKKYDLNNEQVYIREKGLVKVPVIEEKFYEDQVGKPNIPTTKTITYYDKEAGADKEIEGTLTSFIESTAGHWENLLKVEGIFMAPGEDCDVYELAGSPNVTVARNASTPAWPGYEKNIADSLGLSSRYYRVNGCAWNGAQYAQDGYVMRNAFFTGDMFVSTYKATYEAQREVEGYGTKVFYRVDADSLEDVDEEDVTTVYHIKAIVTYKLVE